MSIPRVPSVAAIATASSNPPDQIMHSMKPPLAAPKTATASPLTTASTPKQTWSRLLSIKLNGKACVEWKKMSVSHFAVLSCPVLQRSVLAYAVVLLSLLPPQRLQLQPPKRVVSGVQPTGSIHLGNYFGAIKNWVALQNVYETLFFIVDLHAITLPYDTQQLSKATRSTAAIYLACGVDPSKASVFVQSHVRSHVELMWLLSSTTPIGWLNKMIQFKEKSRKAGDEEVGVALLTYPVLMASDILLYQSDLVPVGEDQKQHLELTRDLAERVNNLYGGRKWKKLGGRGGTIFKASFLLFPFYHQRVYMLSLSLTSFTRSEPSLMIKINGGDPQHYQLIANKIKRCKTDSFPSLEFDNSERPECNNLLSIYQLVSGKAKEEVVLECQNMNWGTFKTLLTDALIDHLHPIQVRYEEFMSDSGYLDEVLAQGARNAAEIADATLDNVYQAMGFLRRK
ncbi:Tryptophan--tRNA ligase [Vigna angularis]|uniref:tryptophan--tRNA ligase n=1 Tax=Phaseolus angularis TaxID=3914 RepID=A0A8T0KLH1_PHAAN|nr:Tryptophan--tRNA ligase [Vigna angularis]